MTFEQWMSKVDAEVERAVGLSADDLADAPYYDMYEDGRTPKSAAMTAIRLSGGDV